MQPWFQIGVNGVDVTGSFSKRAVTITLTDQAGVENDKLTFTVDDRPPHLIVPARGSKVSLSIGYAFQPNAEHKYNGVRQFVGIFEIDEVRFSKPPSTLQISAHANNTGNTFKSQKDRSWDDKTIKEIAEKIAGEHGLQPVIEGNLGAVKLEHVDQPQQSDMDFLTRLARRHGGIMKVAEGKLVIAKEGMSASIGGQPMVTQIVSETEVSNYDALLQARSDYDGSTARWHDWELAKETEETEGELSKTKRSFAKVRTKDEAKAHSKADKEKLDKETETLTFTAVGNPRLMAETLISLVGFRPGMRTGWRIKTATHKLDNSGYTTTCQCELPEAGDKNASTTGRA